MNKCNKNTEVFIDNLEKLNISLFSLMSKKGRKEK